MGRYLLWRILRGLLSVVIVVGIVMVLVYSGLDRELVFASDPVYSKQASNGRTVYKMQQWEKYGYVDYVPYTEYLLTKVRSGELSQEEYYAAASFADTPDRDSPEAARWIEAFREEYEKAPWQVVRLNADKKGSSEKYKEGGQPRLFAYRDIPVLGRLGRYLTGFIFIDTTNYVQENIENRGLTFTWRDPVYGGEKFSPAILGNGTRHKYLLYCDSRFPFVHQNFITLNLGTSYAVSTGSEVWETLTSPQGSFKPSYVTYPTGVQAYTADDLHSAQYAAGSLENGTNTLRAHFTDDYTLVRTHKQGLSKLGYSFLIGILAVALSYLIAIPLALWMARKRDKLPDRLGSSYIVFIMAVPSLAYIFLFKAIGGSLGLPTTFDMENPSYLMYVLPVISLALPAAANLMKWLRRYLVDQMSADYVRFARAGGLSSREIFRQHIFKNAVIPIVHGIPAAVLLALTGAIITERVYVVPGAGNVLTRAINAYDNGVIVGLVLFYGVLSVSSVILGDVLMSVVDPRISLRR
ncbi:MAG: ABC transporter permease [Oscillospiraceae bacterium]|nr:ABC transporter permease [Oscillospiraceae bacterium]